MLKLHHHKQISISQTEKLEMKAASCFSYLPRHWNKNGLRFGDGWCRFRCDDRRFVASIIFIGNTSDEEAARTGRLRRLVQIVVIVQAEILKVVLGYVRNKIGKGCPVPFGNDRVR